MASLDEILKADSPLSLLKNWLEEARQKAPLSVESEAIAMTISTVDASGAPSSRVVLIKQFTENGPVFFTNYDSKKAEDLKGNPQISVNFHWHHLGRQVQIRGKVQKTPRSVSEEYWNSRPRKSQLSQWISQQSKPLGQGQSLQELYNAADKKFQDQPVPCPENWGGFEVIPWEFQFWIGKDNRLHDRVQFLLENSAWVPQQLYP